MPRELKKPSEGESIIIEDKKKHDTAKATKTEAIDNLCSRNLKNLATAANFVFDLGSAYMQKMNECLSRCSIVFSCKGEKVRLKFKSWRINT